MGTAFLTYTRANVLGDSNQYYFTGTDSDITTQKANIDSTGGYLVDGTKISSAKEFNPGYIDANNSPYGGNPTGWSWGGNNPSTDFLNQRIWNPGQCPVNTLRIASAVKNKETVTIGADVLEVNTQAGRSVAPHIPIDCTANGTAAQGSLTSNNTNVSDGDTVTLGTKAYTFDATTVQNIDGHVLIGADADTSLANLRAAINLSAGAGTLYAANTTANAAGVSCGPVIAHVVIITALAKGTAGNSIAFSKVAATLSVDSTTLGTTTSGVDPTATQGSAAFIIAVNNLNTQGLLAIRIGNNETLVTTSAPSDGVLATTETLTGSNNAWDQTAMRGGRLAGLQRLSMQSRVPTTQEVTLTHMHFAFDFPPQRVDAKVVVTATPGVEVAWDGTITVTGNHVTLDSSTGSTHLATTDTVILTVTD